MIFEALAGHLQTVDPVFVMGQTVFLHRMSDAHPEGLMLRNSNQNGLSIDHEVTGLRRGRLTALYRSPDVKRGTDRMALVMDGLTLTDTRFGRCLIKQMFPLSEPIPYPVTGTDNVEFSVEFHVVYAIIKN